MLDFRRKISDDIKDDSAASLSKYARLWLRRLQVPRRAKNAALLLLTVALLVAANFYANGFLYPALLRNTLYHNLLFEFDYAILEPGHQPVVPTELDAMKSKLLQQPLPLSTIDAPHWDAQSGSCICRSQGVANNADCVLPTNVTEHPTFTMVTALVDVGRQSRSPGKYLNNMFPHLARDVNLVVFAEEWAMDFILDVRKKLGYEKKTWAKLLTKNSRFAFYHLLPQMKLIGARNYPVHVWHGTDIAWKLVGRYAWLTNEKIGFVMQAAEENPFHTSFFLWMDAGGGYGKTLPTLHSCPCNIAVPGTATLFHRHRTTKDLFEKTLCDDWDRRCRLPTPALDELSLDRYVREFWRTTRFNSLMGTFWGGDAIGLARLFDDWNHTLHSLIDAHRLDIEQGVMPLIAAQRKDYLRFVGGSDFGSIVNLLALTTDTSE